MDADPHSTAAGCKAAVRPARDADLPAAAPVYRHADVDHAGQPDGSPAAADTDRAVLEDLVLLAASAPESVWIAEDAQGIAGLAAAAIRPPHWHLAYLFVEPRAQGRGIGRRLLDACHDTGRTAGCTIFSTEPSNDPRAIASYLRLGMMPAAPALGFVREAAMSPPLIADGLAEFPVALADQDALATVNAIDETVRGARRPQDHRRWLAEGGALSLLRDARSGEPAGYVAGRPQDGFWRLGPAAALDADLAPAVLERSLHLAARLAPGRPVRVIVPAANSSALTRLPALGFRPTLLLPLMQTGPVGRWDRYLFADLDVL